MHKENFVASAAIISTSKTDIDNLHPGATIVVIEYPENWDKPKMFENGQEVHTSEEIAKHFVEIGIGKLKEDKSESEDAKSEEGKSESDDANTNDDKSEGGKSEDEKKSLDYSAFDIAKAKEELQKRGLPFAHNAKLDTLVAILQKDDFAKA